MFGKMFGTEKALTGIVSGVTSALDSLCYTDQERSQDAAKERSEARGMVVGWMESTKGQNISRRFIAISTTTVWLSQIILGQIISIVAIFVGDASTEKLSAVTDILNSGADDMSGIVMLVFGFYFAAPHMGKMAQAFVDGRAAKVGGKTT